MTVCNLHVSGNLILARAVCVKQKYCSFEWFEVSRQQKKNTMQHTLLSIILLNCQWGIHLYTYYLVLIAGENGNHTYPNTAVLTFLVADSCLDLLVGLFMCAFICSNLLFVLLTNLLLDSSSSCVILNFLGLASTIRAGSVKDYQTVLDFLDPKLNLETYDILWTLIWSAHTHVQPISCHTVILQPLKNKHNFIVDTDFPHPTAASHRVIMFILHRSSLQFCFLLYCQRVYIPCFFRNRCTE